ncbi:phage holin family protein [Nocardioides nitrophenolicus]|uniref:phage holin family protein n=1 Tax=Nocardioides nitrophenolicus TaxID=60489 RepID=UPI000AB7B216|nr:phage holin family protein [Nocardioides nitrophenolicus]MBM7516857.1 putative membrane protein [Nocardioides nitrophenolicus]
MLAFLSRWVITAAALALAAQLIDGIWFEGATEGRAEFDDKILPLVLVALISCVVTAWVKPLLTLLSIPFILVTLGLFLIVLNALLLRLTAWLADVVDLGFHVSGFWPAVWGSIIISITTWFLDAIIGFGD